MLIKRSILQRKKTITLLVSAMLLICIPLSGSFAQDLEVVETVKDEDGWRLTVDGRDFPIKGMVWAFTPLGENYSYDLWSKPDAFIMRMIDTDMILLRAMGVNTIRCFSMIPPRWISYIYDRHGIYTMVNDLMGRYGVMVNGKWMAHTDYSDPATRKTLLQQYRKTLMDYKDTRGVLMFMLGNESNYGLEWSSSEIENLPSGERLEAKARFLYSLFGEAIALHKEINPNHPVGIVNGDLQYLQIIKEEAGNMDIFGVNSYRGKKAYDLFYQSVAETLDKPMVYTEIGADAYNVSTEQEDQLAQAYIIKSQVEEMYYQAWGKGRVGNLLGAYIFEWIDEWWKQGQTEGLDVHDTVGTWNNGAYDFDAVPGKNNMNEEWFGVVGQSKIKENGIHKRLPRAAYYTLQKIWTLDPIWSSPEEVKAHFAAIEPAIVGAPGLVLELQNALSEKSPLKLGASLNLRTYSGWNDKTLIDYETMKANANMRRVENATLSGVWTPAEGIKVEMDWRIFGQPFYPSPNSAVSILPPSADVAREGEETAPIELFRARASYKSEALKADIYYRDGHSDWYQEGDFFNLLPEAYDRLTMTKDGSRAPFGVELQPQGILSGLTLYAGPELYYGGFPMAMAKYWKQWEHVSFAIMHQEELAYPENFVISGLSNLASKQARPLSRASSAYVQGNFLPIIKGELGVLMSQPELVGKTYQKAEAVAAGTGYAGSNYTVYDNQPITWLDTMAAKLRLSTEAIPYTQLYVQGVAAGLVADSKAMIPRSGSQLADIGSGNRIEGKAGALINVGHLSIAPTFLYRKNISGALPDIAAAGTDPAIAPRNWLSPFMVWDNRDAIQGELVLAWDSTGDTYFFDWNNNDRENAPIAASISALYNFRLGPTDAKEFISSAGPIYVWEKDGTSIDGTVFRSGGQPAVSGTWSLAARAVSNPLPGVKIILEADAGQATSTSIPDRKVVSYGGAQAQMLIDRFLLSGGARFNAWGPEPWYQEFNLTYPMQWNAGIAYGFEPISLSKASSRLGILVYGQELDQYSKPNTGVADASTIYRRIELQTYLNLSF